MIYEPYQYFHDVELIRRYSPTIDAVLGWFDRQLNSDGLVDDIPDTYWQFVDWVSEWRDLRGVPAAAKTGPLTVYNLMYALGLQKAAELNSLIRRDGIAQEYLMRSQAVTDSVLTHCWSEQHQFFKDGPDTETYSQHAQIWAVLAHAVIGDAAVKLMEDTLAADHLAEVSYAMTFFLLRALSQTGLYHRSFDLWDPWRSMIQMHLTTWAEDPVTQRSDCHAWGSLPLYEFTTELLGVRPSEDSAEVITIRPEPGDLLWAQGVVVTAFGLLHIRWQMTSGTFWLTLHNPSNITVRIIMPDGTRHDDTNRSVIGLEQHKE
jgi:alpha-L-rhamnosidase